MREPNGVHVRAAVHDRVASIHHKIAAQVSSPCGSISRDHRFRYPPIVVPAGIELYRAHFLSVTSVRTGTVGACAASRIETSLRDCARSYSGDGVVEAVMECMQGACAQLRAYACASLIAGR
jgi:hypothetical protein